MEFKGTQGNWHIDYSNKTHFIFDDNRVLIAEVDEHITHKFNTPTPRACKANAQLIGASLDLFEALKSFVYDCYGTEMQESDNFKKGLKALKKATK